MANDTNDSTPAQGHRAPSKAQWKAKDALEIQIRRARLNATAKAVLLAFHHHSDVVTGHAFPGPARVELDSGVPMRTAEDTIRALVRRGWLTVTGERATPRGRAKVYAITPVAADIRTPAEERREEEQLRAKATARRQRTRTRAPMSTAGDGGHVHRWERSMSTAGDGPISSQRTHAPQSPTVANRGDRASVVADADATKPPHPVTDGQGLLSHDSSAPVKCSPSRDSVALDATVSSEARVPLAAVLRTPPVTGAAEPDPEAIEGGEGDPEQSPEGWPWAPLPGRVAGGGYAPPVVALDDDPLTGDPEQSAEGSEASARSSLDASRHRDQPDAPQARTRTGAVPLDPDDDLSGQDHTREGYQWTDPTTAARVARMASEADEHVQRKRDEKNARDRETRWRIAAEVRARPGGPRAVDQVAAEVTARPALAPHVSREWIAYALRDHPLDAPLGPRTLDAIGRALDARPVHGGGPKAHGAIASRVRRAVLEVLGLAPADEQPSTVARPKARKRGWFAPVDPSTMKAKRDRRAGRASA